MSEEQPIPTGTYLYSVWGVRFLDGGLIGIFALSPRRKESNPIRVRLWRTRKEARAWLKEQRAIGGEYVRTKYLRGATVVPVAVDIIS